MKVVKAANFGLYVYQNDHPPPHCHIRFKDGSDISVDLPLILPRYGATVTKEIEDLIEQNLDALCDVWEKLNQKKKNNIKKK